MTEFTTLGKKGKTVGPIGPTATLHTINEDIEVIAVPSMDIVSDYANNISDYIYLELLIGMGTYSDYIRPYADNLELTLSFITNVGRTHIRYKAIVHKEDNDIPEETLADLRTTKELDTATLTIVKLQLLNREVEVFRLKDCSGVYADVSIKDVLMSELGKETSNILVDSKPIVTDIVIDPPDNGYTYQHLMIPDGIRAISLLEYLHNEYGVYSNGVGMYHVSRNDKRVLFLYSTYNTDSRPNRTSALKIVNDPDNFMSVIDTSYYVSGGVITIVVGKETTVKDDMGGMEMSDGVGIRTTIPQRIFGNSVPVQGDLKIDRSIMNSEFYLKDRVDSVNYAPVVDDNQFKAVSNAVFRTGKFITVTWTYSNFLILEPGQSVTYVSGTGSSTRIREGVLVSAYTHVGPDHVPQTILTIFVKR